MPRIDILRSAAHDHSLRPCKLPRCLAHRSEISLVRIVQDNLHCVLALRNIRRRFLKLGNFVAWEILSYPVASPDAVDLPGEDLAGIKVERDFDGLTGPHVFEALLEEGREHVTVGSAIKAAIPPIR